MPQFPLVVSAYMSRSFGVILAVFLWCTGRGLQDHMIMNTSSLSSNIEIHLEMMVCVAFVVSLMECAIYGVSMYMLNYVLNELYVQYTKTNCQHVYLLSLYILYYTYIHSYIHT